MQVSISFSEPIVLFPFSALYWIGSNSAWQTASLVTRNVVDVTTPPIAIAMPTQTLFKAVIITYKDTRTAPTFPTNLSPQDVSFAPSYNIRWLTGDDLLATTASTTVSLAEYMFDVAPYVKPGVSYQALQIALTIFPIREQMIVPQASSVLSGICFDGTYIWVSDSANAMLVRVESSTGTIVNTLATNTTSPGPICFDGASVWAAGANAVCVQPSATSKPSFTVVTPMTNGVCFDGAKYVWATQTTSNQVVPFSIALSVALPAIAVGSGPTCMCSDGVSVYVVNTSDASVSMVDIASLAVTKTSAIVDLLNVSAVKPVVAATNGASVWVLDVTSLMIFQLGAADLVCTNTVAIPVGSVDMIFDGTTIWVLAPGEIVAINPMTLASTPFSIPALTNPGLFSTDGTNIWITNGNTLVRYILP